MISTIIKPRLLPFHITTGLLHHYNLEFDSSAVVNSSLPAIENHLNLREIFRRPRRLTQLPQPDRTSPRINWTVLALLNVMLCDIWEPSDNWSGISDQARRKKLQNKLNQRAYR